MGFVHIIFEFEKEGKVYSIYKTDIPNREFIEGCIKYFRENDVIYFDGYKINTTNCISRLKVFKSNEEFNKCKEKVDQPLLNDVDLIKNSDFFIDITDEFELNHINKFKTIIK